VLLAEDHRTVREQLKKLLVPEFDVIATVSDGYGLIAAAQALHPDVVVSDISMPGLDGIDATMRLVRSDPAVKIVLVSVHDEAALVRRGLEVGAMGYVLKISAGEDLLDAVHAVLRGERFVSSQVSGGKSNIHIETDLGQSDQNQHL